MEREHYRLSPKDLGKEAGHIELSEKGIIWNVVRRGEDIISRISYGTWTTGKLELLLSYPGEPYVVPTEPEPEEMFRFVQLAKHAIPESIFTNLLRAEVIRQLTNRREELKDMIDEISGWGKQELEDTLIPHQQEEE